MAAASHPCLQRDKVAVITGAGSGIGLAAGKHCVRLGMKLVLADVSATRLETALQELENAGAARSNLLAVPTDVTEMAQVEALRDQTYARFGACHFLFLNAGLGGGGGPIPNDLTRWRHVMEVDFFGVLHGLGAFANRMITQADGTDCVIAMTSSRMGVTTPPGDTAYNVAKAGVRVLAESLEHKLRTTPNCKVSARLLLPGTTNTPIAVNSAEQLRGEAHAQKLREKGAGTMGDMAITPEDLVKVLFDAIDTGKFYAIGYDGEQSQAAFKEAVRWSAEDIASNRPPLSRWHPEHRAAYLEKVAKL